MRSLIKQLCALILPLGGSQEVSSILSGKQGGFLSTATPPKGVPSVPQAAAAAGSSKAPGPRAPLLRPGRAAAQLLGDPEGKAPAVGLRVLGDEPGACSGEVLIGFLEAKDIVFWGVLFFLEAGGGC